MIEHLASAWSEVLDVEESEIEDDDNFFEIGGDSVTALRLVTAAKSVDIEINAEIIFNHPVLSDMKAHCEGRVDRSPNVNGPRPTLDQKLVNHCASVCGVDPDVIEDVFPSLLIQTWLLNQHLKAKEPGLFFRQIVFQVEGPSSISAVMTAFEAVWGKNDILRTRLVQHEKQCYQVVLRGNIQWGESSQLNEYLSHDKAIRMNFGDPLTRFAVVKEGEKLLSGLYNTYLLSPSVYLESAKPPPFKHFVQYEISVAAEGMSRWKAYMNESKIQNTLWTVPENHSPATTDSIVKKANISFDSRVYGGMSLSTIAHGAFSLAYASMNGNFDDVVYTSVRMGRQVSLQGIEAMMGPLLCTIPLRVRPNSHSTVLEMMRQIQTDAVSMMPYEQLALPATRIPGARLPVFNWRMNDLDIYKRIVKFNDGDQQASIRASADLTPGYRVSLALHVGAQMVKDELRTKAAYDGVLLEISTVNELIDRFLRVLRTILERGLQASVQEIMRE